MTDEAKAKLAIARAKGLETRKRNAELRRRAKQEKQEEQQIVKEVRRKRLNKLKKELEEPEQQEVIKPERVVEKVIEKGFTQEDMNQAISKALEANEKARKARKAEKKKRLEEEAHEKRIYNTVARAVNPNDAWSFCFE